MIDLRSFQIRFDRAQEAQAMVFVDLLVFTEGLDRRVQKLESDNAGLRDRVTYLEHELATTREQVTALQTTVAALQARLDKA